MSNRKRINKESEYKEYVALTISRNTIRYALGDKVADQMTDEKMKQFALALNQLHWDDKETWQQILEEVFDLDFSGEFTISEP